VVHADAVRLINSLLDPRRLPDAQGLVELIETHISWVLLAGEYAWKLKKPVNFGFVDFSTLERRRFFCEEEIRLNGRLAPGLYLRAVPITGTTEEPVVGGTGEPIEYAVQMRRFAQDALLSAVLQRGGLSGAHVDGLAADIAEFHQRVSRAAPKQPFGRPERVHDPVRENFGLVATIEHEADTAARLEHVRDWAEAEFARRRDDVERRKRDGFVRECHGDMHLGNMLLDGGRVLIFDGIEFNENLRWIDVLSELAFTVMDLEDRGRPDFAHRLLNSYLERTGDYAGLVVLPYYQCYRAMVRAKVAALRCAQTGLDASELRKGRDEFGSYLALAERFTRRRRPCLVITHGVSGSGKTHGTQPLVEQLGFVRLRSDVERKRLCGIAPLERVDSVRIRKLYSTDATERTFDHLAELVSAVLRAGFPVVVDATFLKRSLRERFRTIAARAGVPYAVAAFHASEAVLRERVGLRSTDGRDASDADLAVLARQMSSREPLGEDERADAIDVDSEHAAAAERLVSAVAAISESSRD
jgi:aminoglycoside phosphotransferase family enzyme/predicted kinase